MKVLCIDNTNVGLSISVGKWYEVFGGEPPTEVYSGNYIITSDRGNKARLSRNHFVSLEEMRAKKLEELGI